MTDLPHKSSYQQTPEGLYLIVCARCSFKRQGSMTRNEAHDIAYRHTANPGGS